MELLELLKHELSVPSGDGKLCVAFSGGVDSALLVKTACKAGLEVHAVTFDSTLQPAGDALRAAAQAQAYGALHRVLRVDPLADPAVRGNGRERCYRCKYALFSALRQYAENQGISRVADGTNADDLQEFRPGLRALQELSVESPLAKLGITKAQVRKLAEKTGLDVAKRPSSPCLATRFPYGTELTPAALRRCGEAEETVRKLGFAVARVRVHGDLARVEVPAGQIAQAARLSAEISGALRRLGYRYVTLDLDGYRSGCYDKENE